jgi:hypothetical protein
LGCIYVDLVVRGKSSRRIRALVDTGLAYIVALTLAGSVLGIAMDTAGAQAISTMLRWIHPSIEVAPFLKVDQALQYPSWPLPPRSWDVPSQP